MEMTEYYTLNLDLFRVGHRVLLRSERIVLFNLLHSFKARNILLCSFFKSLATYETQKNDAFFCVLFYVDKRIFYQREKSPVDVLSGTKTRISCENKSATSS